MKKKSIAIYGGSFNPPTHEHVEIVRQLALRFDEVYVVPCGDRPDKASSGSCAQNHRRAMVELAFMDIEKVSLDFYDFDNGVLTRTYDLQSRYQTLHPDAVVCQAIGSDLVVGGSTHQSEIERSWYKGEELWNNCLFAVSPRAGYEIESADMPRYCLLMPAISGGSSTVIREKAAAGEDFSKLLPVQVAAYVSRHRLYK